MAMKEWTHGMRPTAAELNAFKTDLDAAHTALGDYGWNVACKTESEAVFHIVHGRRYLHYGSSGTLVDIFGVNEDVSLSSGDGDWATLDLDSLGWLGYGRLYKVTGVSWALEDGEA